MHDLHTAVRNSRADLEAVVAASVQAGVKQTSRHVLNARQLLHSLTVLETECDQGTPRRRAWSFGQASVPVLSSTLNGISKQAKVPLSEIDRCRASLAQLAHALNTFAEGR